MELWGAPTAATVVDKCWAREGEALGARCVGFGLVLWTGRLSQQGHLGQALRGPGLCLLAVPVFLTALMCGLVAPTENVPGPGLSPVTVSPDPALGLRVASPANPSAGS